MGLIENFAKGFLICTCVVWIFVIVEFFVIGQPFLAILMIIAFIVPASMILYGYLKTRRTSKAKS